MTRYSTGQLAVAIALAAVGVFAAFIRVGDALVQWASPR